MAEVVYLVRTAVFFICAAMLVRACERNIARSASWESRA